MFSYYGSKSKIISYYPKPSYGTIIEPFAGSARYASLYFDRQVWINDSYDVIYKIWKWIQTATKKDILQLPDLKVGETLNNYKQLSDAEKLLLGFAVNMGVVCPKFTYTKWAAKGNEIGKLKQRLLKICGEINHWRITNIDYNQMVNCVGTWFIDPPYQFGGEHYIHNNINYRKLFDWCDCRKGEIIVCENSKNTWLHSSTIVRNLRGQVKNTVEVMYYKKRFFASQKSLVKK